MLLEIFDVGHGACALITSGQFRVMIDCASNQYFGFAPGDLLEERAVTHLDLLIITNFDEDHARGLPNLLEKVKVGRLLVNRGVTPEKIDDLKGFEPGDGIRAAIDMAKRYNNYSLPALEIPEVSYKTFRHSYPTFEDENNLSLVVFINVGGVEFVFPGDMETAGWEALIDEYPEMTECLKKVHVFVAPHHGRDNGICDRIFDECGCKPKLVVISDKAYLYDTQETIPYYRSKVDGGWKFRGNHRHVLTTRKDGTITFVIGKNAVGTTTLDPV